MSRHEDTTPTYRKETGSRNGKRFQYRVPDRNRTNWQSETEPCGNQVQNPVAETSDNQEQNQVTIRNRTKSQSGTEPSRNQKQNPLTIRYRTQWQNPVIIRNRTKSQWGTEPSRNQGQNPVAIRNRTLWQSGTEPSRNQGQNPVAIRDKTQWQSGTKPSRNQGQRGVTFSTTYSIADLWKKVNTMTTYRHSQHYSPQPLEHLWCNGVVLEMLCESDYHNPRHYE